MRALHRLRAVDAFCGAGGFSLGLSDAGFEVSTAFDIDECSINTYEKNLGPTPFISDVRNVGKKEIYRSANLKASWEIDLLVGGPPCQGFSKQKRGGHLGDDRNKLVLEFLRLVNEVQPRSFVMENVETLAGIRGMHLVEAFRSLNSYNLHGDFYVAADYGVPQTRRRYFVVGIRSDLKDLYNPPEPASSIWPTVGSVFADLPEPPNDYSEHPDFPNHQAARVTPINVKRFSYVPQGGGWRDIPIDLRLACHKKIDYPGGGWTDVYGRLEWDGQCRTVTGGFDSFTRGRYGHPLHDRPITAREAARLQGFPDSFVFTGNRADVRRQIGNAVPVPMAAAIARSVRNVLVAG
ncbi:DNA cytosine methyltransferase [soil metagenome]